LRPRIPDTTGCSTCFALSDACPSPCQSTTKGCPRRSCSCDRAGARAVVMTPRGQSPTGAARTPDRGGALGAARGIAGCLDDRRRPPRRHRRTRRYRQEWARTACARALVGEATWTRPPACDCWRPSYDGALRSTLKCLGSRARRGGPYDQSPSGKICGRTRRALPAADAAGNPHYYRNPLRERCARTRRCGRGFVRTDARTKRLVGLTGQSHDHPSDTALRVRVACRRIHQS
jgi:hypothetical protein